MNCWFWRDSFVAGCSTYQGLDVEALSGHDLSGVLLGERLQDGGLAGVVEAEHEDSGLTSLLLQSAQLRKESHIFFLREFKL